VLSFDADQLPAYAPAALADAARPPAEYRALSEALGCPDVFLLDAAPGPDQLTVAAQVAVEAARAGERVLLIAPTPATADALLARLADGHNLLVGRALTTNEHPDQLPAGSASRTARRHADEVLGTARAKGNAGLAEAVARLAALRAAATGTEATKAAAARLVELTRESARLLRTRADAANQIAAEAHFIAELRPHTDALAAELAGIDAEAQKIIARQKQLAERPRQLVGSGGRSNGMFARLFKGLLGGDDSTKCDPVLDEETQHLEAEAARLAAARSDAERAYAAVRDRLLQVELTRRQAAIDQQLADVNRERERIEAEVAAGCQTLHAVGLTPPATPDPVALEQAAAPLPEWIERAETDLRFARQRSADLDADDSDLASRLLAQVRIVVGTLGSIGADPLIPAADAPVFDRLVLTDADHIRDAEFAPAGRAAARWVLIGDTTGFASRNRPRSGRSALFRRLWEHLHRTPWILEDGRLVARLVEPGRFRRDYTIREPLADRPEIELRFATGLSGDPVLAEVVFPPTTSAAEAKTFLAQELNEVRLSPCGPVRWHEADDRVIACWPAVEAVAGDADWAELAPGVRERVAGTGPECLTVAVDFDKAAGWTDASAAEWLAANGGPGRHTASWPRPVQVAENAPNQFAAGVMG
jgi:hypothetical protein